jgi:hypothetical protein
MGQSAVRTSTTRDRRAAARIATTLRGKVFPGAFDCVIADFTKKGARLRFDGPAPPGASFIVVVWSSGVAFEAHPRWRRTSELGVQFISSRDLRRPAPPYLEEAQAAWMKRRPRVGRRELVANPDIVQRRARGPRRLTLVRPEP